MQRAWVLSLVRELDATKSLDATAKDPACCNEDQRSHMTQWRLDTVIYINKYFGGFPCGSAGEESTCNAGDLGSIPGLGRSPGEGKGYSLQYSGLENSMDSIVHGVTKNQIGLSDFHFSRVWQNQEIFIKLIAFFNFSSSLPPIPVL